MKNQKQNKSIIQIGNPILRKKSETVQIEKITDSSTKNTILKMWEALLNEDDGVALAAPQIGISLRIFIIAKGALTMPPELIETKMLKKRTDFKRDAGFLVFINPEIKKLSQEKAMLEEGCLSVRPFYGKIKRSKKATIVAYDETGRKFTRGATGLLAQIFQHECDHLDGILFSDKATDLREIQTDRIKK